MKIFYFDVETTGTDPIKHDIVQLAYVFEIDGKIILEDNLFCQPFNYDTISQDALNVNNLDLDKIQTFPRPNEIYNKLMMDVFSRYIDKFNRSDKFYPAGYNVSFDLNFLHQFFIKNHNNFFGSYCNYKRIDPLPLLWTEEIKGKISLPNYKLQTVCDHYGIQIKAHDAMSDINATIELIKKLIPELRKKEENAECK